VTQFSTLWPAIGATGALLVFLLGYRMARTSARDYLDAADLILLKEERRREARLSPVMRLAGRLVPRLRRLIGPAGIRYLQGLIDQAGRPPGLSVDVLLRRICWWMVLLLPLAVIMSVQGQLAAAVLAPAVAVLVPLASVSGQGRRRRESIDRDLPDFLDILAVTVNAGISFRSALARVIDRFAGPISDELRLTLDQMNHGASTKIAFLAMQRRSGSTAMRSFTTAFLQADELGAPLAETLNQIALDMRRENAQALRRKAAQTVPKVTLVTSLIMVPAALILVIAGLAVGSGIDLSDLRETLG
jgi:tight adherence protein C